MGLSSKWALWRAEVQAVILAAGKGKRLHPITAERSKAMLPILGKPMVVRVMEQALAAGICDFIVVVDPDDQQIAQYYQFEANFPGRVQLATQPRAIGAADALACAAPWIQGDFLLSACDNLTSTSHIQKMLDAWDNYPGLSGVLTLMPVAPEQFSSTGIVGLDGHWVRRIIEKPALGQEPSNIASLPLYIFSDRLLHLLKDVKPSPRGELELQEAIQTLIDQGGDVLGIMIESRHTVTTLQDYLRLNLVFLDRERDTAPMQQVSLGKDIRLAPPVWIGSRVVIGVGCTVGPDVYIEGDCTIGDEVSVQNAVVLSGAKIPAQAKIVNCVVN
jgi:glucose-1-phosphate thymidylyltransferase